MIKGIVFDMDGVLVKTIHIAEKVAREKLKPLGIKLTKVDINNLAGYSWKEFLEYISKTYNLALPKGLLKDITKTFSSRLSKDVVLYDGTVEVLTNFSREYLLALASGSLRHDIDSNLDKFDLRKYFKATISSSEVKKGKPAPDLYSTACQKLNLNANECVGIEDSVLGIKSVKNAGMKCIAVTHTLDKSKLQEADVIVDNLNQISKVLTKL